MNADDAARLAHIRRWGRPDFERWLRPDWERYVHPAGHEAMRREIELHRKAFEPPPCSSLRLRDVEGIIPLAAGCLLLAYIEGISAARNFAAKHGYALDTRQEFLGLGAANFAAALGHGYPVAGGLSQSAVNDMSGARTPLALVFASLALALCLLFPIVDHL